MSKSQCSSFSMLGPNRQRKIAVVKALRSRVHCARPCSTSDRESYLVCTKPTLDRVCMSSGSRRLVSIRKDSIVNTLVTDESIRFCRSIRSSHCRLSDECISGTVDGTASQRSPSLTKI